MSREQMYSSVKNNGLLRIVASGIEIDGLSCCYLIEIFG